MSKNAKIYMGIILKEIAQSSQIPKLHTSISNHKL